MLKAVEGERPGSPAASDAIRRPASDAIRAMNAPIELKRLLGAAWLFVAVVLFYVLLRLAVSPRVALVGAIALGLYCSRFPFCRRSTPSLWWASCWRSPEAAARLMTLFAASASLAPLAVTLGVVV